MFCFFKGLYGIVKWFAVRYAATYAVEMYDKSVGCAVFLLCIYIDAEADEQDEDDVFHDADFVEDTTFRENA